MGDGIWHNLGPKGGGDLRTGTAGKSVNGCSLSSPLEMIGFIGRTVVTFIVLGEGLPIPGIDFFEDFPLLMLAVILPFLTSCLDPMLCLNLILLLGILLMNRGMESTSQINLHFIQQNLTFMA